MQQTFVPFTAYVIQSLYSRFLIKVQIEKETDVLLGPVTTRFSAVMSK